MLYIFPLYTPHKRLLKLVIHKNIRPSGNIHTIGDEVYYKRDDAPEWKGPDRVLGQDSPVVFIRHGSRYIKAHTCRVQPTMIDDPNNITEPEAKTPPAPLMKPKAKEKKSLQLIMKMNQMTIIPKEIITF